MNGSEPSKLKPALIAGIACGAASSIPVFNCINFCCCALAIGGGVLAAFIYLKDAPGTPEPAYGDGAVVGLLTGIFGAITATLISIPFQMAMAAMGMGGAEQIQQALEQMGDEIPPEFLNLIESISGAGGFTFIGTIITFGVNLVLFSIFAMIGGIIGMALLHGKVGGNSAPPPQYAPPPPPAA